MKAAFKVESTPSLLISHKSKKYTTLPRPKYIYIIIICEVKLHQ